MTTVQKETLFSVLLRLIRGAVAVFGPQLIAMLAGVPDAKWSGLAPILLAISKYVRNTWPGKFEWLPV